MLKVDAYFGRFQGCRNVVDWGNYRTVEQKSLASIKTLPCQDGTRFESMSATRSHRGSGHSSCCLLPAACCLPALSAWLLTQGPLANARVYETDNEESKDSDPEMRALREMRQIEARISTRAFQFKADPRPVRSINDVSNDTREQALK
jgi:hypothetical protein